MTSDLDVYRTAALIVEQHGDEAPIHAAMRADKLMVQSTSRRRLNDLDPCSSSLAPRVKPKTVNGMGAGIRRISS